MIINTKIFGEIEVNEEKVIHFENGIIGFPDLKKFLLIYDEEKEDSNRISWLQSVEEQGFAIPVINPLLVKEDYSPIVNDELLVPIGELDPDEMLVLVTITIPNDIEKITVNLKAPIIINAITRKSCQIIVENDEYIVKYPVYDKLKSKSEKVGE